MPDYQDDLTASQNNLANLYRATGRGKEAEAAYQSTLAVRKALAKTHPDVPSYQQDLARSTITWASSMAKRPRQGGGSRLPVGAGHSKAAGEKHPDVPGSGRSGNEGQ